MLICEDKGDEFYAFVSAFVHLLIDTDLTWPKLNCRNASYCSALLHVNNFKLPPFEATHSFASPSLVDPSSPVSAKTVSGDELSWSSALVQALVSHSSTGYSSDAAVPEG